MKNLQLLVLAVAFLALAVFAPSACASTAVTVVGKTVTFSYTADGTQPFTQQWRKDGVNLSGATAPTYVIQTAAASDAGIYTVIVSNAAGSATSDEAVLSFILAPSGVITGVKVTLKGITTFYPMG